MTSLDFDLGLGSGLAVAGLLYGLLWWWTRRATLALGSDAPADGIPSGAREDRTGIEPTPAAGAEEYAPAAPPAGVPSMGPATDPGLGPRDLRVDRPVVPNGRVAYTGVVRLSQRVILHVYAQGTLPPGAVAPPGLCQAGIGEALGVTQGGLVAALRRLEAAGILTVERGHVQGQDRRLKIYRLSSRGLELARELRTRSSRAGTPSIPSMSTPDVHLLRHGGSSELGSVGLRNQSD